MHGCGNNDTHINSEISNMYFAELKEEYKREWKRHWVENSFNERDDKCIQSIKLYDEDQKDTWSWKFTPNGDNYALTYASMAASGLSKVQQKRS